MRRPSSTTGPNSSASRSYDPSKVTSARSASPIGPGVTPGREKRCATMAVEGIPHGDTAMSRAVALPAAIAGRLFLEDRVSARGVIMPTEQEIYEPVLTEMKTFGFEFIKRVQRLS